MSRQQTRTLRWSSGTAALALAVTASLLAAAMAVTMNDSG